MKIIREILSYQMIRYSFVAIINTIFSYGVYALGVYLAFTYQIASLASVILGIIFSFMTQGALVFRGVSILSFVRYVGVWGGTIPCERLANWVGS